jgi:hypothetical protein
MFVECAVRVDGDSAYHRMASISRPSLLLLDNNIKEIVFNKSDEDEDCGRVE